MTKRKTLIRNILAISCFISPTVLAHWHVNNDQSNVYFISTKKEHISELHHFTQLSGELNKKGKFSLTIRLASVETGIDIRNKRMNEHLFKVDTFPTANLTAQLPNKIMQLTNGQSSQFSLPAKLTLANHIQTVEVSVQVTKTNEGYIATSIKPILLSASEFGLTQGITKLQELAGLPSIGLTVPVSFNLHLKQD